MPERGATSHIRSYATIDERSEVPVLGTIPGPESLRQRRYYATHAGRPVHMLSVFKDIFSESIADRKIRKNIKSYIFQSLLTFICVGLALMLHELFGGFIVASLGASSFIVFITPHTNSSRPRNVIGGYISGAVAGILLSLLHEHILGFEYNGLNYTLVLVCAAASALTTLLMVTTGLVHPPAAALAIGLAADKHGLVAAVAALLSVIILCAARWALRKHIKNLI